MALPTCDKVELGKSTGSRDIGGVEHHLLAIRLVEADTNFAIKGNVAYFRVLSCLSRGKQLTQR